MSGNIVRNTLTQSDAIESYTSYDILENNNCIFCQLWSDKNIVLHAGPELNSKIMNQCNIDFNFLE